MINTLLILSLATAMSVNTTPGISTTQSVNMHDTEMSSENPVVIIVLNSDDQMKFDKQEIRVKAGQTVRLTLNHTGKLPKNAMGHNFVLIAGGTDMASFAQIAMQASDNEYIPEKDVLAHTKLIGGGESTTIEFEAPEKGNYDFICSFPGHYYLMKGKFIVE